MCANFLTELVTFNIDTPAWLRSLRLHKYNNIFEGMQWRDIVNLSDGDLINKGVAALGARRKMLKVFEQVRKEMLLQVCLDISLGFLDVILAMQLVMLKSINDKVFLSFVGHGYLIFKTTTKDEEGRERECGERLMWTGTIGISIKITVVIRCQQRLEDDDKNNKDEYDKERERRSRRIRGPYLQRKKVLERPGPCTYHTKADIMLNPIK